MGLNSFSIESMAGSDQLFGKYKVAQNTEWLTFLSNSPGSKDMVVKTLHVSCKSDKFDPKKNFIGFVLYRYLGQDAWTLNNVHCKTGYIYFIESSKLDYVKGATYHARALNNLFGVELGPEDFVASGFAFQNGVWKVNSTTFNYKETPWTDGEITRAGVTEMELLKNAIVTWTNDGCQNISTKALVCGLQGQKFGRMKNQGFD